MSTLKLPYGLIRAHNVAWQQLSGVEPPSIHVISAYVRSFHCSTHYKEDNISHSFPRLIVQLQLILQAYSMYSDSLQPVQSGQLLKHVGTSHECVLNIGVAMHILGVLITLHMYIES